MKAKSRRTGWNGDNKLEQIFREHGAQFIKDPVVIDGVLITANGPQSATEFGTAIVNLLKKRSQPKILQIST